VRIVSRPASGAAVVLTALTLLFLARVAGQALVVFLGVSWLPPVDAWYSGLLPYPILLPAQVVILAVQAAVDWAAWTGRESFVRPRPRAARALRWFSYAYALAMAIRYGVTGSHAIPVAFHWVLAVYVYTLAGIWRPAPPAGAAIAGRTPRAAGR
jgi:hypothetical protein